MPSLPEEIWKRRLESEYNEMSGSGLNFDASSDYAEYTISLRGPGFYRDFNGIRQRDQHSVRISLNRNYPYAGGIEVVWLTPIFHPNIREEDGLVCIQLVNDWAENQTVASVVKALQHLLETPNSDDPLNYEAADYFRNEKITPVKIRGPKVIEEEKPAETKPKVVS